MHAIECKVERALGETLARVCISAGGQQPSFAIAYSGGLDSTALLFIANRYAKANGMRLLAFHIHHGLSPNADAWSRHCESTCKHWHIPFAAQKIAVERTASTSVEAAARVARYRALADLCEAEGISVICTAHHRDDQAETVLLQLMRGAGLPGLSGMPVIQRNAVLLNGNVTILRPMLDIERADLEAIALRNRLVYVDDESNRDPRFKRNGLRHIVMPHLVDCFPSAASVIARSAGHFQAAQELLDELAAIDLAACDSSDKVAALDASKMRGLSVNRQSNLLRYWLRRQGLVPPNANRLGDLRRQMIDAHPESNPSMVIGNKILHRYRGRILLNDQKISASGGRDIRIAIKWAGEQYIALPEWKGKLRVERGSPGLPHSVLKNGLLAAARRRGGERFQADFNRPSRSLKNLYQERGVPVFERDRYPLIFSGDLLIYVPGLGMNARHLTREEGVVLHWEDLP